MSLCFKKEYLKLGMHVYNVITECFRKDIQTLCRVFNVKYDEDVFANNLNFHTSYDKEECLMYIRSNIIDYLSNEITQVQFDYDDITVNYIYKLQKFINKHFKDKLVKIDLLPIVFNYVDVDDDIHLFFKNENEFIKITLLPNESYYNFLKSHSIPTSKFRDTIGLHKLMYEFVQKMGKIK